MGQCGAAAGPGNFMHTTVERLDPQRVVRLAITPLNKRAVSSRLTAYHTSISIDDVELSFGKQGIRIDKTFASHETMGNIRLDGPATVRELGMTTFSPEELVQAMLLYFQPDSYDLLLKNCNTFSDCALSYLLGKRLDQDFNSIDRLAGFAEQQFGFVGMLIGYTPNPKARVFMKDNAIVHLKSLSGHLEKRIEKFQEEEGWVRVER